MPRLARLGEYRFVGVQDTMRCYDCDDPGQYSELEAREAEEGLVAATLISTFSPDTLAEALNRGFKPA